MDELTQIVTQRIADGALLGFIVVPADVGHGDGQPKAGKLTVSKLGVAKTGMSRRG